MRPKPSPRPSTNQVHAKDVRSPRVQTVAARHANIEQGEAQWNFVIAQAARYAAVGRALADPKRLCVLESLSAGELSVSDLSTKVGCQVPNMSQHLAVLRSAGLVQSHLDSREDRARGVAPEDE